VAGVQYAIQPHDSIDILPFRGFVSSESFLRVIYPLESTRPSKQSMPPSPLLRQLLHQDTRGLAGELASSLTDCFKFGLLRLWVLTQLATKVGHDE
jgi:hypothetical protein